MMNSRKLLVILSAILYFSFFRVGEAAAVIKQTPTYLFGIVISLTDETIYMTDIQLVDSAFIDEKKGFLYGRDSYSYQLREYMKSTGYENPTCITSFAKTRKAIEKKYVKFRKAFSKELKEDSTLKFIDSNTFAYKPIIIRDENKLSANESNTSSKTKKANNKKKNKE
jgi:hypothetical protein